VSGPLAGLTVLELAGIGPAPLACTLLADLGAHVLRVDRPGAAEAGMDQLGHGRPHVALDLRSGAGVAALLALVDTADVLVEGNRPGVTERLGVGPDACRARNPRLVYARMTGWGQDGPLAQRAGHDINYLSMTGALHAVGERDRKPVAPLNLVADFGGGTMFLLVGILAALQARATTGEGQVVDAAMVDGAAYLMTMPYRYLAVGAWTDERGVNLLDGGMPYYDTYPCADGRHVAVGAIEPQFFAALLTGLGLPPEWRALQNDAGRREELRALIAAAFVTRTRDAWAEHFAGTDACVTPVLGMTEAPAGEHLAARGTFETFAGATVAAPAPRFSETPARRGGGADRATLAAFGLVD